MNKQMKRTVYVAPTTERFQVELEGGLCAASYTEINNEGSTIEVEEYDSFDNTVTFD